MHAQGDIEALRCFKSKSGIQVRTEFTETCLFADWCPTILSFQTAMDATLLNYMCLCVYVIVPPVVFQCRLHKSEEPGDLQLEVPQVSEEETVSSPIKKTSPSPQKAYTCTEVCSFLNGGGGKRIRCYVCARHYYVKCLNLPEDEIKGHAWPCLECRVLPHNAKYIRDSIDRLTHFMSSMMNDKITEIKDLKLKRQNFQTENETLRQRSMDLEYEMTALKSKLTDLSPTSRTPKDSLVLSSSLVRNIDPNKLTNTNVCCMPGAKIADIRDKLMNLSTAGECFGHIYLVVGGNDCTDSDIDMAQTVATYRDAVTTGKDIADNVTISATPPRSSPTHALQNIVTLNTHLSSLSTEMGVSMASAYDYFFLQGGDINGGYFVDHTHLTVRGSNKLAEALSLPGKIPTALWTYAAVTQNKTNCISPSTPTLVHARRTMLTHFLTHSGKRREIRRAEVLGGDIPRTMANRRHPPLTTAEVNSPLSGNTNNSRSDSTNNRANNPMSDNTINPLSDRSGRQTPNLGTVLASSRQCHVCRVVVPTVLGSPIPLNSRNPNRPLQP